VFALFAGIYHWFPQIAGRELDQRLGKIHFWGSFVCMNLIFMPMFAIGLMGVNRRLWDAGASYAHAQPTLQWQTHMTYAAFALGVFQLPFVWNLFRTWSRRSIVRATVASHTAQPTGTSSANLGMWLFLASEAMLFASLFSAYVMLRMGAGDWPKMPGGFPWVETVLLVGASAAFGPKRSQLVVSNTLGLTFVVIKVLGDIALVNAGTTPATNLMWACWFALTAVHGVHVLGGAAFTGWLAGPAFRMADEERDRWLARIDATRRYWLFVDFIWLMLVVSFYFV
jgi:heme/copper-type cytochrome/quinol oxidase subunit 3